jgi:hypothetical protein
VGESCSAIGSLTGGESIAGRAVCGEHGTVVEPAAIETMSLEDVKVAVAVWALV